MMEFFSYLFFFFPRKKKNKDKQINEIFTVGMLEKKKNERDHA